jgi:hypothetical protein
VECECKQKQSGSNFAQANLPDFFSGGSENVHEFFSLKLLTRVVFFYQKRSFFSPCKYTLPAGFGKGLEVRSVELDKQKFGITLHCSVETRGMR